MQILKLQKLATAKSIIKSLPYHIKKERGLKNYDEYVKISPYMDKQTFSYIDSLKSTIGNYAKHNNLFVTFEKADNGPQMVKIDVFAKEHPILARFYDFMEMVHDEPLKLNTKDIFVKVNPEDKNEVIAPSRKIFAAISDVMHYLDTTLNPNLK